MKPIKHFFVEPPIQTPDLVVHGIGVHEPMQTYIIDRPHGTGDCLLMFFYTEVWLGAGKTPRCHPPYRLMLWTPGTRQYYGHPSQPFSHTWIHVDGTWVRRCIKQNRLPVNTPFALPDPTPMERALLAIHAELTGPRTPDEIIVRDWLEIWLRDTARQHTAPPLPSAPPPEFLQVRHYLETEYASRIRLADLARRLRLSIPHFCVRFKQLFGVAPIDYLIRQRLHRAAYLLQDANLSVKEAAGHVGYEDLFYFSKLFKKHYGLSPRAYRQRLDPAPLPKDRTSVS